MTVATPTVVVVALCARYSKTGTVIITRRTKHSDDHIQVVICIDRGSETRGFVSIKNEILFWWMTSGRQSESGRSEEGAEPAWQPQPVPSRNCRTSEPCKYFQGAVRLLFFFLQRSVQPVACRPPSTSRAPRPAAPGGGNSIASCSSRYTVSSPWLGRGATRSRVRG